MQVKINGVASELPEDSSITDVLTARKLSDTSFIVALNGEIVLREHWANTVLSVDDDMEIIRIVGGG